jgi:hypothetical protein
MELNTPVLLSNEKECCRRRLTRSLTMAGEQVLKATAKRPQILSDMIKASRGVSGRTCGKS